MLRASHISLVGHPNAGKSTLLNCLLKRKLGVVSPKANTTRFAVWGSVAHRYGEEDCKIYVTDTPGWDTQPKGALGRTMTAHARDAFYSASCLGLVIDAARTLRKHDRDMFDEARGTGIPVEVILTKTDLVRPRDRLLPKIAEIQSWGYEGVVWLVSAHSGRGIAQLYEAILTHTTDIYPEGDCSLTREKFAAECVREHAFRLLNQELPYKLYTETNVMRYADDGALEIHCLIKLEEERHKAMVLGRGGDMIKRIGTRARHDLMRTWNLGVRLFLTVKVVRLEDALLGVQSN